MKRRNFLKTVGASTAGVAAFSCADQETALRVAGVAAVAAQDHSLSIPLYVKRAAAEEAAADREERSLAELWAQWEQNGPAFWLQMDALAKTLDRAVREELARG